MSELLKAVLLIFTAFFLAAAVRTGWDFGEHWGKCDCEVNRLMDTNRQDEFTDK